MRYLCGARYAVNIIETVFNRASIKNKTMFDSLMIKGAMLMMPYVENKDLIFIEKKLFL